jgi:hypothetical protein
MVESVQHLRHASAADAEVAGESSAVLELTRIEKGLVVPGELERIAGFFRREQHQRFRAAGTVPGKELDNRRST